MGEKTRGDRCVHAEQTRDKGAKPVPQQNSMIVMMGGEPELALLYEMPRYFAREFGWDRHDYEVRQANPEEDAPYLVICLGEMSLRNLVWNNPHEIFPDISVGVIPWTLDWSTVYDPPPFQAWIRLVGLPYNAWNNDSLRKVTTGLGTITAILPYGRQACHFRHITLRLACENPGGISRYAKYHEGGRARRVRITLLQWRERQAGPYPLDPNN